MQDNGPHIANGIGFRLAIIIDAITISFALFLIVAFSRDRSEYFADKLYNSMSGLGTDDETLQRIIITHCEVSNK